MVRGNHQFGIGGNVQYWQGDYTSTSRANGNWIFDGRATGLGLADLMVGRVTSVEHGGLGKLPVNSWYVGGYAQDSWRVSSRVTINGGVRWEPFFGQNVENGVISVFDMENFQQRREEHGVPQRAGRSPLRRRCRVPGQRQDRAEQAVVEPFASRRRRVGRAWRWPAGRAHVVCDGVRLHVGGVPQHQRERAAVRQPVADYRPSGALRQSLRWGSWWRSASDYDRPDHAVPGLRLVRDDGSRRSTRRAFSRGTSRSSSRSAASGVWRSAISGATPIGCGRRSPSTPACSWDWAPARSTAWRIPSARPMRTSTSGGRSSSRTRARRGSSDRWMRTPTWATRTIAA